MTSNKYYCGLNNRFERRAERLRALGFAYQPVEGLNMAVFTKRDPYNLKKARTIPAAVLHLANNHDWCNAVLGDVLLRTR